MLKKIVLSVVMVVVGAGIGFGSAMMIDKPKMDKSKTEITDLQGRVQQAESQMQENSRTSGARIMQLNVELSQVRAELDQAKAAAATTVVKAVDSVKAPVLNANAVAPLTDPSQGPTTEYTIKDGDSFWSIAQSQLGNGDRAKEISKLNPDAASRKYLIVGSKLKLPAK
jgi:hypothetical protein